MPHHIWPNPAQRRRRRRERSTGGGRFRLSQASGRKGGRQSTYLEGEIGVDFATQWLEGSACQLIGTRVPADVYQGVELGSNGGCCGGNDGQVEEKEIVCHGGARQDGGKLEACRIVVRVLLLAIVGGILA